MEDDHSTTLLAVLAVAFIHLLFALAVLQAGRRLEPRWVVLYVVVVAFYGAVYVRRLLWLHHGRRAEALYRGLGYVAIMLGASLSVLFFYSVNLDVLLAIGVWLGLAIVAYFFYRVITLHLEEEEVLQVYMRSPV